MQSRNPSNQQWILKKAERCVYDCCVVSKCSLHERYNIDIYTQRTTKLFTPIIKSFVPLKMLIQNKRIYGANFTQWVCTGCCESWILSLSFPLLWTLDITIQQHAMWLCSQYNLVDKYRITWFYPDLTLSHLINCFIIQSLIIPWPLET